MSLAQLNPSLLFLIQQSWFISSLLWITYNLSGKMSGVVGLLHICWLYAVCNGVGYSGGPDSYDCFSGSWISDWLDWGVLPVTSVQGFETVWICGRRSDLGLLLSCLVLCPMRCLNAHCCHGLSPHESISEIPESVLYDLQFEVDRFLWTNYRQD